MFAMAAMLSHRPGHLKMPRPDAYVQRSGEKIRINAQLADTTTDAQLWSESFDGSQGDLFALQEMVTARIGNSIGREMVIVVARDSLTRKSEPNVADLMIRASAENLKPPGKANFARVQALYRQVLDLEANNVQAVVRLAMSLSSEAYDPMQIGDPVAREEQFAEARSLALRAKELGSNDPFVYGVLSDYALEYGDHVGAIRLAETALSLDPKNPRWYSYAGAAYVSSGQPLRGIELLMQGLRLNPKVGAGFSFYLGLANFMLGDNDAAIKWLQKSVDEDPGEPSSYACLAIVYAHIGDHKRTKAAVAELLQRDPKFNLSKMDTRKSPAFPPAYREFWETKLLPAWRLAGLPE